MDKPRIITLNYTYKKPETEVWVLNIDDIPIDKNLIKDQQIVHLAPQTVGGNHKHPRTEWFIGIGDLIFVWLDENRVRHEEHMHPHGEIKLITVPPFVPHAVKNISHDKIGVIFELADAKAADSEKVQLN